MNQAEIEYWAAAYIEAQQDSTILEDDHPLWWAIEKFMVFIDGTSAEDSWATILEVLARNPPKQVLGILAAGPLEYLIEYCGPDFIERIETESASNPAFRELLKGVWESSTPEVWARVEKARGILQ